MKKGDIVTNGHVHPDKTLLSMEVLAIHDVWVWCMALAGPHEGSPLTFKAEDVYLVL